MRKFFLLLLALALMGAACARQPVAQLPTSAPSAAFPAAPTQTPAGEKTLPDGTVVKADGTMVKPDGTMVKPDGTIVKPDGTMIKPDGTMVKPDGTMVKPDGTMVKPDGTMVKPDGTIVKLDGTMIKPDGTMVKPDGTMIKPDGTMVKPDGTMVKPTSTNTEKKADGALAPSGVEGMMAKYTGTVLAGKSAPLIAYNKADYEAAIKSDKLVALYFTANWCPICKVEIPNLYAAFNELTTDKVVGFRVDYNDSDTDADEKDLARQLNVVYQHTKVFLKNGKQVLKSPESWSKERNLSEINKALAQ